MSVLGVWNKALSAVNARGRLSSLTDRSPEQEVCDEWYTLVRDVVQAAAWWPSCKTLARLALLSETDATDWADGQPEPGYAYAYATPANYLHPWHLTNFDRFSLSYSSSRNRVIISTNTEEAILVYARRNEDPTQWTPGQLQATIHALALKIAGPLTGKNSQIQLHLQQVQTLIMEEQAKVANMIEPDPRPSVPWLAARGVQSFTNARFFYPFGTLASLSDAG